MGFPPAFMRNRALVRVGVFALAVALERWGIARGSRRIRHVDAHTGDAPTLRQTILLLGAREAIGWLLDRTVPKPGAKQRRVVAERQQELKRVQTEHPGDANARNEAVARLYRPGGAAAGRHGVEAFLLPMVLRVAVSTAVHRGSIPLLREPRTLADLVAGTRLAPREPPGWTRLLRPGRAH